MQNGTTLMLTGVQRNTEIPTQLQSMQTIHKINLNTNYFKSKRKHICKKKSCFSLFVRYISLVTSLINDGLGLKKNK